MSSSSYNVGLNILYSHSLCDRLAIHLLVQTCASFIDRKMFPKPIRFVNWGCQDITHYNTGISPLDCRLAYITLLLLLLK